MTVCLPYFPRRRLALDIRHVEERLWKVGRALYSPDPRPREQWVEDSENACTVGERSNS